MKCEFNSLIHDEVLIEILSKNKVFRTPLDNTVRFIHLIFLF